MAPKSASGKEILLQYTADIQNLVLQHDAFDRICTSNK